MNQANTSAKFEVRSSPLTRLYPILDATFIKSTSLPLLEIGDLLRNAGITLLQYRNKHGSDREMLADAAVLRSALPGCRLIFNDRADLAILAGFDGVHVGQGDLSPERARRVVGPGRIVGVSTHNQAQLLAANATSADYIAIGPVFETSSKLNPDPEVGLEGVALARQLVTKPLVAIGGITSENCRSVREAGADSVAVISAVFSAEAFRSDDDSLQTLVRRFHERLQ